MFASTTKVVQVHESAETFDVTIQKLSWKSLEKAALAQQGTIAANARAFGGEILSALRNTDETAAKLKAALAKDPKKAKAEARYGAYDLGTILQAGIKSWTHPRALGEGEARQKNIEALDQESAQKLHEEIVDLSVPLPEVVEEQESKG